MKKTYVSPEIQVVKIELQQIIADSIPRIAGTTNNVSDLLGRDTSTDWDDDWND